MSEKSKTEDEKFIISLYQQQLDADSKATCPYDLGRRIGQSQKAVKTMVKLLTRSNFVKKDGDSVRITCRGRELAETLLQP